MTGRSVASKQVEESSILGPSYHKATKLSIWRFGADNQLLVDSNLLGEVVERLLLVSRLLSLRRHRSMISAADHLRQLVDGLKEWQK